MTPSPSPELACWLRRIEAFHPNEIELGLARTREVYHRFSERKPGRVLITVGGTNGKGTTVAALERLLLDRGYRVGAYTSPHLRQYNERVRVGGVAVSDAALVASFEAVEAVRQDTPLTFFEFGTLAALSLFERADLDFVILEVGLGGRLDAVNVVDPDFAVLTSIDLDHQHYLGDTRDKIGFEKAGILRPGIIAVCGDPAPPESVVKHVAALKVRLLVRGRDYGVVDVMPVVGSELMLAFRSSADRLVVRESSIPFANLATALQVMTVMGFNVTQKDIDGLATLTVPGRLQRVGMDPVVLLDVGHNPHAAAYLAQRLDADYPGRSIVAVFSALIDKDVQGIADVLRERVSHWVVFELDASRAMPIGQLTDALEAAGVRRTICATSVADALGQAGALATNDGSLVLAFGSFYVVEQVLQQLDQADLTAGKSRG